VLILDLCVRVRACPRRRCAEASSGGDVGCSSADDVTRAAAAAAADHVTGSGRCGSWCAVLVVVALTLATVVSGVEYRGGWYGAGGPVGRLDVKVYPRHSVLGPQRAVTVQCSVRALTHRHRARLRVGFYVSR